MRDGCVPVAGWSDEVKAALHPAVGHLPPVDAGLSVQIVLELAVDVIDDRLPAETHTERGHSPFDD